MAPSLFQDADGTPLYAGRAFHKGDLLPGKVRADGNVAYVPYGGSEVAEHQFEVNIFSKISYLEKVIQNNFL